MEVNLPPRPYEEPNPADDDEFEVEQIISHRRTGARRGRQLLFEVRWKGYKQTTFEPVEHLMNALDLLNEYESHNNLPLTRHTRRTDYD
jgi:hypothetical protein